MRAYCYGDGQIFSEGERTAEEIALEIPAPEPGDHDTEGPEEEDSFKLAAAWGLDVYELDAIAERTDPALGWLGRLDFGPRPGKTAG